MNSLLEQAGGPHHPVRMSVAAAALAVAACFGAAATLAAPQAQAQAHHEPANSAAR